MATHHLNPLPLCNGRGGSLAFLAETVKLVKEAFRIIYRSKYNTQQAVEAIRSELPATDEINSIIEFIENSERGIIH